MVAPPRPARTANRRGLEMDLDWYFGQNPGDPRGNQPAGDVCARSASAVPRHRIRGRQHAPQPQEQLDRHPADGRSPTPCGRLPISWPTSRKPTNWPRRPDSGLFRDDFPSFLIGVTAPTGIVTPQLSSSFRQKGQTSAGMETFLTKTMTIVALICFLVVGAAATAILGRDSIPAALPQLAAASAGRRPGAGFEQGKQEGPACRRELRAGRL